jgi:hypothetical protein
MRIQKVENNNRFINSECCFYKFILLMESLFVVIIAFIIVEKEVNN